MSEWMDRIVAGKAKSRKRLAALPFSEKIVILEKLRDRSLLLARNPLRARKPRAAQPKGKPSR